MEVLACSYFLVLVWHEVQLQCDFKEDYTELILKLIRSFSDKYTGNNIWYSINVSLILYLTSKHHVMTNKNNLPTR